MSNVGTIYTIKQAAQYLGDGVNQVLESILRFLPPDVRTSDGLSLYVADAVHTIVAITTNVSRPLAVIAKSNGTLCFVKVYPDKSSDVTVGTTSALASIGVSATLGEISSMCLFGAGVKALTEVSGADGLSIAAPATDVGTGAVANDPTVYVLYSPA